MKFDKEKEVSGENRPVKFHYSREERFNNSRLVSPRTKSQAFGLFKSSAGKIGLLAFTFLIIAMVWYFNRMNRKSDRPEGSFKTVDNVQYRVYAYKQKTGNRINAYFYIKNKSTENKILRFYKLYIKITDNDDKTVKQAEFLKNVKILLSPNALEQFQIKYSGIKLNSEYTIYAAAIDEQRQRVIVKMRVKT